MEIETQLVVVYYSSKPVRKANMPFIGCSPSYFKVELACHVGSCRCAWTYTPRMKVDEECSGFWNMTNSCMAAWWWLAPCKPRCNRYFLIFEGRFFTSSWSFRFHSLHVFSQVLSMEHDCEMVSAEGWRCDEGVVTSKYGLHPELWIFRIVRQWIDESTDRSGGRKRKAMVMAVVTVLGRAELLRREAAEDMPVAYRLTLFQSPTSVSSVEGRPEFW